MYKCMHYKDIIDAERHTGIQVSGPHLVINKSTGRQIQYRYSMS